MRLAGLVFGLLALAGCAASNAPSHDFSGGFAGVSGGLTTGSSAEGFPRRTP